MFIKKLLGYLSDVFLFSLIFFIAGIFLGNFFVIKAFYIFCFILFLIFLFLACNRQKKYFKYILIICIFFAVGIFRIGLAENKCNKDSICYFNDRQVKFIANVYEVSTKTSSQQLKVSAKASINGVKTENLTGNVLVNLPLYPKYNYGDLLILNCKLKTPEIFEDFNYSKFLATKNIHSICSFAQIAKIDSNRGFILKSLILKIKDKLSISLKNSISEPQSSILRAMILNDSGDIPAEWNNVFSKLGLTHIIAISGSHITIITLLIMYLAIAIGLSRPKAFWVALGVIAVYVIMIGFPASAVRAAIMGILFIYAQKIGRKSSSTSMILLAASIMLLFNPLLLLYDAGFQLSFVAVIGLIYLSPLFSNWLKAIPNFFQAREMLVATLAAQLMTLPLIFYHFGFFSPISVLANLLILPIIPFLTIFALSNAIVGALIPTLGTLMGYVSWLFTSYWIQISILIEKINLYSFNFKINWFAVLISYISIGFLIFKVRNVIKNKF